MRKSSKLLMSIFFILGVMLFTFGKNVYANETKTLFVKGKRETYSYAFTDIETVNQPILQI